MKSGYIWIGLILFSVIHESSGQRYSCLTISYPGKSPYKKTSTYGSPTLEFNRKHSRVFDPGFPQSHAESDDSDESDESEEAETGGGYGGEEMEADEEIEAEDDEFGNGFQNMTDIDGNYTSRYIDDRKKRQAPFLNITRMPVNSTEDIMEVRTLTSQQNITSRSSRRDDGIHDDKELTYEYEEYHEYDSNTINSNVTVTNTSSFNSSEKFTGVVRCPNPSQKLHFRKVVTGYSSTGYCVRDTTYCAKDITDSKQVIDCEGVFGECKLELPIEGHDSCQSSNYVKIEYDCIYDHSLLDICSKIHVSRWREVAIRSPSYPASASVSSAGIKTCECEIVTDDKSALSISYLTSDMSGSDDKCDEEVLLFEEKYNANNSSKFQVTGEICGKKSSYSRRFGDNQIRMTYLIGGIDDSKKRGGFLTRISAHSFVRGNSLINVKCSSVATNAAGQPNRNHLVRAVPTPIRKTIIAPVFVKERKHVSQPVPVFYQRITTVGPQTATTPRWRVGPRGRKYIPRPGNPNGPLFLDGLGPAGVRRRYPVGGRIGIPRRYRPGLRRRILRTTAAPVLNFTDPELIDRIVENTTKNVELTTIGPIINSIANNTVVAANSAGAVMADEEDIPVEATASASAQGTLIAVIASISSILVIVLAVGFYYFYRRRQKTLPKVNKVPSDTGSIWFSEYYYGISNFFKRKFSGDGTNTTSQDGNTDESTYESYDNGDNDVTVQPDRKPSSLEIITTKNSHPKTNSQSIFGITTESQLATSNSLEVILVAPPRRKRNKLAPPSPATVPPNRESSTGQQLQESVDYDNSTATDNYSVCNSNNDDTYDNCISAGTPRNQSHLTPIIEIRDHENTEYASIPEMISMFNSEC